jgi:glycosyltransferase involved in cell wall biosynthesis
VTLLINLLSWQPGHSGFGSYVQRVGPGIPGTRLQLDDQGRACLIPFDQWMTQAPPLAPGRLMRLLQRNAVIQHGQGLKRLLHRAGLRPEVIYSPFFDALLAFPQIPQLITCHDLTPLSYPNSRKAWLKYRFWQPRHLACATRVVAISRHVAEQLIAFGVASDRVVVVPNGIAVVRPPVPAPASEDLLVIARHDANKNLLGLLKALATAQKRLPQWHGVLRIVGRGVVDSAELQAFRRALPRPDGLELIEELNPAQLLAMLRGSLALVSASLEEGFDYPVLEAKAEGIPTLLSQISVHDEFHAGTSLFFPAEGGEEAFAVGLSELLTDSRLWWDLSARGRQLALSLSVTLQQRSLCAQIAELS